MESGLIIVLLLCGLGIGANAQCVPSDDSCKNCPPGWKPFEGRCYVFLSGEVEWVVAERYCIFLGGNLASIHSKENYNFLRELTFTATGTHKRTWVGATDAVKERGWLWSDGSMFNEDFCFWGPGEPDYKNDHDNCMVINMHGKEFAKNVACNRMNPFICSRIP